MLHSGLASYLMAAHLPVICTSLVTAQFCGNIMFQSLNIKLQLLIINEQLLTN